jgi:2-polyprenyl-6-methoxyphenol hydroxylase-like FAD-dependent oxidoreductase
MATKQADVLIIGAGPTGLTLALWLARLGVNLRIIEKNSGPGQQSRAMAVQARTLEFYRQLGFAEEAISRGFKLDSIHLREAGVEVAHFHLGDLGAGLSPYPFVLSFPQDDHERLLIEQLSAAGVEVEWETELTAFREENGRVDATLHKGEDDENVQVAYLCGCDGARSTVRQGLGLDFQGGTYAQTFFVADTEATCPYGDREVTICLGEDNFFAIFPIRSSGMRRALGTFPPHLEGREDASFEDVRPQLEAVANLLVSKVNWFTTYRVHHRVTGKFRVGRVFIAGDAAHVHSPAGGQGMNTGIGDAVNLAWKLAAVLNRRASPALLDTYEAERLPFAKLLVSTTDAAFQLLVGKGLLGKTFRTLVLPHIAPALLRLPFVRTLAFKVISQTRIRYRESALSTGHAGNLRAGDRLPWLAEADNFAPLQSLDWQIHIYGDAGVEVTGPIAETGIPLHRFAYSEEARAAGMARDAIYLIRPDGYLALIDSGQDPNRLANYLNRLAIRPAIQHSATKLEAF